jgi:hypothetical protein
LCLAEEPRTPLQAFRFSTTLWNMAGPVDMLSPEWLKPHLTIGAVLNALESRLSEAARWLTMEADPIFADEVVERSLNEWLTRTQEVLADSFPSTANALAFRLARSNARGETRRATLQSTHAASVGVSRQ